LFVPHDTPPRVTLEHTRVTGNTLTGSSGVTLQGGGLFTDGFPVTLTDSRIEDNTPTSASAADRHPHSHCPRREPRPGASLPAVATRPRPRLGERPAACLSIEGNPRFLAARTPVASAR